MYRALSVALLLFAPLCVGASTDEGYAVVKDLFAFLTSEHEHDGRLGKHPELIQKWLSPQLAAYANAVECDVKAAWREEQRPLDYVSAAIFFDRWDTPMTCQSGRPVLKNGKHISAVECRWGKGQDHAEGQTMELFVEVKQYGRFWKVENIRHGRQEPDGATRTDLASRLLSATEQSSNPAICRKLYGL